MKKRKSVEIDVMPKKEIFDPQGNAVLHALHSLGFKNVIDVRIGKHIEIVYEGKNKDYVEKMCKKFLSNPVIEDYKIKKDEK